MSFNEHVTDRYQLGYFPKESVHNNTIMTETIIYAYDQEWACLTSSSLTLSAVPPSISEVTLSRSCRLLWESSMIKLNGSPTFSGETTQPWQCWKLSNATANSIGFWESICVCVCVCVCVWVCVCACESLCVCAWMEESDVQAHVMEHSLNICVRYASTDGKLNHNNLLSDEHKGSKWMHHLTLHI